MEALDPLVQMFWAGTSAILVIYLWKVMVGKWPQFFPGWAHVIATV